MSNRGVVYLAIVTAGAGAFAALAFAANAASGEIYTATERRHWAFQPRKTPAVPAIPGVSNPIDAFVQAKLSSAGLKPAPPAAKRTLIRRVTFGLTGLPPAPADVEAFVNDSSPDAYERLVDRLLASRAYAERWAQHWLDVVRFAETDGFEYDTHRADAWRFRDYVIDAFHHDKPFDRFITEQLAGDEMDPTDHTLRVASGFQRLGALRKNAGNQEVASSRNEVLTEMTNIVGAAFLGVTLGCARCHDHKFDPIRHKDYYRMQAFFAPVWDSDVSLATDAEKKNWEERKKTAEAELKKLRASMKGLDGDARKQMEAKIKEAEERMPEPLPALFSVSNDFGKASAIHVLSRGDYQNKGERVGMRPLGVLLSDGAAELPATTKAPRTELARWIADPANPLTARVLANRVWHYHFGRGIVSTPNDFGRMGGRPSHPDLLDWLANRLVEGGWRLKPLHKAILMSATYRQTSLPPATAAQGMAKDPENALLWNFSRRRLDAEEIRDAMLAVSGRLNPKTGGPSVIVPVDQELVNLLYKPSQWAVAKDPTDHDRRSIYLLHKRNLRLPMMEVFDAPDMQLSCPRREQSTHAPQALELMNGPFANTMAKALAARLDSGPRTPAAQVDAAYQLVASRPPTAAEKKIGVSFLQSQPLSEFALAMLNLNAFLYVD